MTKQVNLNQNHIRALRAVLLTNQETLEEVSEQVPKDNKQAEIELENKHLEVLAAALEAYRAINAGELPADEEYAADFDVITEISNKIRID